MDETTDLIRLCVRCLAIQMADAPGFELHATRDAILAFTDEPSADFNRVTLGLHPGAEAFLTRAVERARERGSPLVATLTPEAAEALSPTLAELGFTQVGSAPLMVLRPLPPLHGERPDPGGSREIGGWGAKTGAPTRAITLTRALGPKLVTIAGDLAAAAFEEPRDVLARMIDPTVHETAGFETWIAFDGATPVSAVTITPTGSSAGISLMATPPALQRQGWGRAILTRVIEDYRAKGVTRFHLGATAAGKPLYDRVGFETVTVLSAWLLT